MSSEILRDFHIFKFFVLGWFRDCGIIPFTGDTDIGMWIEEFDQRIIEKFAKNKKLTLLLSFGLPNESYELRFIDKDFQYDCFFIYKYNSTHQFMPLFNGTYVMK